MTPLTRWKLATAALALVSALALAKASGSGGGGAAALIVAHGAASGGSAGDRAAMRRPIRIPAGAIGLREGDLIARLRAARSRQDFVLVADKLGCVGGADAVQALVVFVDDRRSGVPEALPGQRPVELLGKEPRGSRFRHPEVCNDGLHAPPGKVLGGAGQGPSIGAGARLEVHHPEVIPGRPRQRSCDGAHRRPPPLFGVEEQLRLPRRRDSPVADEMECVRSRGSHQPPEKSGPPGGHRPSCRRR